MPTFEEMKFRNAQALALKDNPNPAQIGQDYIANGTEKFLVRVSLRPTAMSCSIGGGAWWADGSEVMHLRRANLNGKGGNVSADHTATFEATGEKVESLRANKLASAADLVLFDALAAEDAALLEKEVERQLAAERKQLQPRLNAHMITASHMRLRLEELESNVRSKWMSSPEAIFTERTGRSIKPLAKIEVLGPAGVLTTPVFDERERLVTAVATARTAPSDDLMERVSEQLAAQARKIEELEAALAKRGSK